METKQKIKKAADTAPVRILLYVILVILSSIAGLVLLFSSQHPPAAHADFSVGPLAPITFESMQNLTFSASTTVTSSSSTGSSISATQPIPLLDQASSSVPIDSAVTLSYVIGHSAIWPNHSAAATVAQNDELFAETLSEQQLYLDLWQGTPFSSTSTMLKSWDITNEPSGQISFTVPIGGPYFLVAYFPDGFYQDPQAMCPGDDTWQQDCAPPSTLDQVRSYFASPIEPPDVYTYPIDAYGGVQFTTAAPVSPPAPFKSSNVLFLPGIEGSRLYMRGAGGKEQTLWEPQLLTGLGNLAMNANGTSQQQVYTRDLVDYVYGQKALGDVYGPFEDFLNGLVSNGSIKKWQAYPYDWRYDVEDVVKNGTLVGQPTGTLSRVYLEDVVKNLASSSPSGKVSIIAHSNGGLVAKALAMYLAKKGESNLVDRIIFIGSPQYGTPLTIGSLLHGDGQTDATGGLVMYGGTVRQVAATMPGMYGLLPSAQYFASDVTSSLHLPVVFPGDPSSDLFAENYGPSISSLTQLSSFLTDAFGLHSQFPADDERTPEVLSHSILSEETSTHAELDAWSPPAGISVYAVSGWGNLTPFQYSYTASPAKQLSCFRTGVVGFSCAYGLQVTHVAENTESGDNTVVSTSALANDTNQEYFNAKSFAANKNGTIGHSNLTSAQPIQSYLKDILTNKDSSGIAYLSSTTPSGGTNPLTSPLAVVSVHSPVNVIATDANGNQTGIFPVAGKPGIYVEKENIPGSSLQVLDDEKYLYVPSNASYTISLQGYDDGLTTIDLGSVDAQGNTSTAVEFSDVPTTADTSASFSLPPSAPTQARSASSIPAATNFPTTIAVDVFGTGSTSPVSATFIAGVSNATTSTTSSPTTNSTGTPQQSLPELFSLLEHIGIAHHLSKAVIDAEFTKLQKDSPTDAGNEITSIEHYVENHLQNVIGTSEETLIIELLEEVRTALAAPGGP